MNLQRMAGLAAAAAWMLASGASWAQSRYKPDINTETPEGKLLQDAGQNEDPAARMALLEKFLDGHASHASAPWAMSQTLGAAQKLNQHDKVIAMAAKLVAVDPSDIEMAYAGLQAAVAKADNDLIIQWAGRTVQAGKKAAAEPEPADEEELERWKYKQSVAKADQAPKRAEYEIFMAMTRTTDPAGKVKALDALTALNPKSDYLAQAPTYYFTAYRQLKQDDKALELAAKAAEANTADEDMLLLLTNSSFEKKDAAAVVKYADQLAAVLENKPAPAGSDQAAWDKKKGLTLGAGYWLKGMTLAGQSKWKETDETLRLAVPLLQDNPELLSHALFNVGLANYKMGNLNVALKFSQECADLKGPKQAEGAKNAAVIRQQGGGSASPARKKTARKK